MLLQAEEEAFTHVQEGQKVSKKAARKQDAANKAAAGKKPSSPANPDHMT